MNINNYYSQYYKLMNNPYFSSGNSLGSSMFENNSMNSLNSMGSLFNDYSMMKTAGYRNLINSYFNGSTNSTIDKIYGSNNNTNNAMEKFDKESYTTLRDNAGELYTSSMKLASSGSKSLFKTDSEGKYDMEGISKAVEGFVSSYNKTLDAVVDVSNTQALRTGTFMVSGTKAFESNLNKIGITIGKDNKLSLDSEKLKAADVNDIKSLFNGTTSYATNMATKAISLSNTSSQALTYNQAGNTDFYYANLYAMKF